MYQVILSNPIQITKIDNATIVDGQVRLIVKRGMGFAERLEPVVSKTIGYFETKEQAVLFAKERLLEKYRELARIRNTILREIEQLDKEGL